VLIYFNQILNGIEAAHLLRVIHRDLKPENILYDSVKDKLLIADFGIARFEEEELYTAMETAPNSRMANFQYAAPEQRDRGAKVDHRADMYALGLILNEMFTGKIPQGTKYRKIGAVCPGYEYLDELVDSMLRQDAEERPISIDEIKKQLIALQNDFVIRQRISELNNRVICVTDLDDPLVADPPRLISIDYQSGTLLLFLSQPVNSMWIQLFKNPNWDNSSVYGKGPERFSISSNKAMIDAREDQVQKIVNHFKEWLPNVNRQYEQNLRREKEEAEQRRREDFQRIVQAEETRMRLLKSIKI
jgi:serine/threonine protein kinase